MLKLTTDKQTDEQTNKQTNRQDKNNMPLIIRSGGIKMSELSELALSKNFKSLKDTGQNYTYTKQEETTKSIKCKIRK